MTIPNQYSESNRNIVIALGDPAGVGIEITLKALSSSKLPSEMKPILVGCRKTLESTYAELKSKGITNIVNPNQFHIEDLPVEGNIPIGKCSSLSGNTSFKWLTYSANLIMKNQGRALVTCPISKKSWHSAGHIYPGQTERLAEIAGIDKASMLFTAVSPKSGWRFNTLLATTHIPLSEITKSLTPELIREKLGILTNFCQRFNKKPTIAIAGLNPHAGEEGVLGKEEVILLKPLLKEWELNHPEINLIGPLPPDTCWISAYKGWNNIDSTAIPDGFLALYHDQGLIPVKLLAFDEAVNTTLGLPFLRTSPDHGTGFDIAGKGIARETSMLAAIQSAWELTKLKTNFA